MDMHAVKKHYMSFKPGDEVFLMSRLGVVVDVWDYDDEHFVPQMRIAYEDNSGRVFLEELDAVECFLLVRRAQ